MILRLPHSVLHLLRDRPFSLATLQGGAYIFFMNKERILMKDSGSQSLEKKIQVRPITIGDYDQLVQLQLRCFPGMKPWQREQIESQLKVFPEGQVCVEYDGKIVASSSSLIIDFNLYGEKHSWRDIADAGFIRNHNPEGDTLYGIEVMVDPDFRGLKFARRLYEARKRLTLQMNLMR